VLTELLLKAGKPFTTKTQTVQATEGKFYYLPEYNTCIYLQGSGLDTRNIIRTIKPKEVIVLNSLFGNDEFLSNTKLEFQEVEIKLTLV